MADVTVKTIETRLQLKYDTYANWTNENLGDNKGANLILLPGEIGICAIGDTTETGSAQATTNPTILFKVGDGVTPFKTLKWASALAADVYAWAKANTVEFNSTDKKIEFKSGNEIIHSIDLSYFADAATVSDHSDRLADIEAALGLEDDSSEESISNQIASIVERLGVIQGADTVEGSIAKALKDAKAYTDEKIGTSAVGTEGAEGYTPATGIRKEIADAKADAITSANGYTDSKVAELNTAIENEAKAREAADKAITDSIGTLAEGETVVSLIEAAQDAADTAQDAADAAQAAVDALTDEDGQVTVNTADIAQIKTDLANETTARENADSGLDTRLKKVEAFFEGAAEDSEGLNDALDTLVEIQNLLSTEEGAAAGELLDAITELKEVVGDAEDGLVKDAADAKADIADLKADVVTLQDIVDGYTDKSSIKTAIEAAQAQADKGVEDAGKAQEAADAAQKDVDDLAAVVGDENSGLIQLVNTVKGTADGAATDVADLKTRMETAESDIDALQAIVSAEGGNSNAQLREDITTLETLVEDEAKGNEALYDEVTRIAGLVDNESTGLAATKAVADDAVTRVAAIEADYLKSTDIYVFNCGSSTTVTHTVPVN